MIKIFILFFLINTFQAQAAELQNKPSQAKLISPFQRVQADSSIDIGIYITLKKGWYTYWQNPGDIGQSLQWNHPLSFSMSSLSWPIPQRIQTQRWINFIYKNNVLVKRNLYVPKNVQNNLSISSTIRWLICKTSCIPMNQDVRLDLSIGDPLKNPRSQKIFQKFIYPEPLDLTGSIERKKEKDILSIQSPEKFELIDFFPIHNLSHEAPVIEKTNASSYTLSLSKSKKLYETKALVVLKRDGKIQANEMNLSHQSNPFILILIKGFSWRFDFKFYALCTACSFFKILPYSFLYLEENSLPHPSLMELELFSLFLFWLFFIQLLKTGGQAVGWGFQMASPFFVSILILLFTFISFSFLDLLSIPVFLKKSKIKDNVIGSFLSGLLITATASPCTAPFMGTAIGYAFSRSTLEILFVFSSLGLGMASPYLLLCFFSKIFEIFPTPRIMESKTKASHVSSYVSCRCLAPLYFISSD